MQRVSCGVESRHLLCLGAFETVSPKVRVAITFIEDNLHRNLNVVEIAQLVRLSRSRLCHLCTREVGMPPTQYLKRARMEKARELLETSFERVKAISVEVGYHDPAYFEREFKKAEGVTPSQYRAAYLVRIAAKKSSKSKRKIL
jgi:AraC-like DNA-binding protein